MQDYTSTLRKAATHKTVLSLAQLCHASVVVILNGQLLPELDKTRHYMQGLGHRLWFRFTHCLHCLYGRSLSTPSILYKMHEITPLMYYQIWQSSLAHIHILIMDKSILALSANTCA